MYVKKPRHVEWWLKMNKNEKKAVRERERREGRKGRVSTLIGSLQKQPFRSTQSSPKARPGEDVEGTLEKGVSMCSVSGVRTASPKRLQNGTIYNLCGLLKHTHRNVQSSHWATLFGFA